MWSDMIGLKFYLKSLFLTLLLVSVPLANSPCFAEGAGTTGADFLQIDFSSKSAALGGSYAGMERSADVLLKNPAGLGMMRNNSFTFSHIEYFGEMRYEYFALAHRLVNDWRYGVNFVYRGSDEVERDAAGRDLGKFVNRDAFLTFGVGAPINRAVSWGVSSKVIYQRLFDRNGWGFALDAGVHLEKEWRWGATLIGALSVNNVGPDLGFNGVDVRLPMTYRASFGLEWEGYGQRVIVTQETELGREGNPIFSAGIGYQPTDYFAARIGLTRGQDLEGVTAPRFGFSFYQKYGVFDYSFRSLKGLDDIHQISYTFNFGR